MIDWSKPIELDDGTPLIVETMSQYSIGIRTKNRIGHKAFPTLKNNGDARRECGLVTSNHRYHVRNVDDGIERIDLAVGEGDIVKPSLSNKLLNDKETHTVLRVNDDGTLRLSSKTGISDNIPVKDVRFACHTDGAPFEKKEFDRSKTSAAGFFSGYKWGTRGRFYTPGGPGGVLLSRNGGCRHTLQYDSMERKENKAYKAAWKLGQEVAREHTLDLSKPLVAFKPDGTHVPVLRTTENRVHIESSDYVINGDGTFRDACVDYILENPVMLKRTGYGLYGSHHTSLMDTLEEISALYHERVGRDMPGTFIVKVEQERENAHTKWTSVDISGPIEPLPATVVLYQPVVDQTKSYVQGVTYVNEELARGHQNCRVLKVTSRGGKLVSVELLP